MLKFDWHGEGEGYFPSTKRIEDFLPTTLLRRISPKSIPTPLVWIFGFSPQRFRCWEALLRQRTGTELATTSDRIRRSRFSLGVHKILHRCASFCQVFLRLPNISVPLFVVTLRVMCLLRMFADCLLRPLHKSASCDGQ